MLQNRRENVLGQEASSVCSSTFFLVEKGQWVELYAHAENSCALSPISALPSLA
jgi:hypothetical protein